MGKYIKKNPDGEGVHNHGRVEKAVLEAWKGGERTVEEIAKITGFSLETIDRYVPVFGGRQ